MHLIHGVLSGRTRLMHHRQQQPPVVLRCPRCDSDDTKFCYYNNYNLSQPRHLCKTCRRYWTKGGVLRNVPVGGGCRKSSSKSKRPPNYNRKSHESSTSLGSSNTAAAPANEAAATTATMDTTNIPTDELITGRVVVAAPAIIFQQLPVSESSDPITLPATTTTASCSTTAAAGAVVNHFPAPHHNDEYLCCPWINTSTVLFDFEPNSAAYGGGVAVRAFPQQIGSVINSSMAAGGDEIAAMLPNWATCNDDEKESEGNWKAAAQDLWLGGNFESPMVQVDDPWLPD